MQLLRRFVLSLCFVAIAATSWATQSPAAQKIADGRAALAAHDLATAQTRFTEARALDANNETAAALLGITQWFALVGDSSSQTFLTGLGIPNSGRDIYNWTAEFPKNSAGQQVLPNAYSSQTALNFINSTMVSKAVEVRGNLAAVTSDNFLLTLSAQETAGVSVTADKGDLLIAQAGLRMFEFLSHFLAGQNLNVDASVAVELVRGNLISLPQMLRDNPNLLDVGSPSERTAARAALLEAIQLYRQGSAFVRGRPAGLERVFMLDAEGVRKEADLRAELAKVEGSLNGYVVVDEEGHGATLAPLFTPGFSIRANLPDPTQPPVNIQTFSGATFGGLFASNTREFAASALEKMGFKFSYGWTDLSATPSPENISKYFFTGSTHVLLGNGGMVYRSTDGASFTSQFFPELQDTQCGAFGNGKLVAGGQSEIYVSTDDGQTWKRVFTIAPGYDLTSVGGSIADIAFDGTKFVAASLGGFTWSSPDGVHWTQGNLIRYGAVVPVVRAMEFANGRFVAVGTANLPNGTGLVTRSAIFSSSNGKDWVLSFSGNTSNQYRSATFGNNRWVVAGTGGRIARSLDNGVTWSEIASDDATVTFFGAGFANGTFMIAGSNGHVGTSPDGVSWTFQNVADNPTFFDVSGSGGFNYLVGSAGAIYRALGTTVTRLDSSTALLPSRSLAFEEGVVFNSKLIAGVSDGSIVESSDGTTFVQRATSTSNALFSMTVHNGSIFAAGTAGTIVSSADGGTNWTTRITSTNNNSPLTAQQLLKIYSTSNGQTLVAVGLGGTLLTSSDHGVTWVKRTTNINSTTLRSIGDFQGRIVVGTDAVFNSTTGLFEVSVLVSTDNGVTWTRSVIRAVPNAQGGSISQSPPSVRGIISRSDHLLLFLTDGSVVRANANNGNTLNFSEVANGLGFLSTAFENNGVLYAYSFRSGNDLHTTLNYSLDEETWVRTDIPTDVSPFGSTVFQNRIYFFGNFAHMKRSSVLVTQPRNPVAFSGGTQTVGLGGNIGLGVPVDTSEDLDFQWSFNGQTIAGANQAVLSLNNVQSNQAGTYTLVATGRKTGATTTNTVTLSTVAAKPFITRQPASTAVALGGSTSLSVEATGAAPLSFAWFRNGVSLGVTTQSLSITNASANDAGTYSVVVTNAAGSTTSLDAFVRIDTGVTGFWFSAPAGDPQESAPLRLIHDGLGKAYAVTLNRHFDVAANRFVTTLMRIDENTGAIDPAFHYDDRLGFPTFAVVQPDKKVLVSVSIGSGGEGSTVIRLNPDGSRDSSFQAPYFSQFIRFITLQSDGNVLVGAFDNAMSTSPAGSLGVGLHRLLGTNGSIDPGFTSVALSAGATLFGPPVVDSSGRIYLAGIFTTVNGVNRPAFARVSSAGVLDTGFADPTVTAQIPTGFITNQARGVAIQSDGKVVIVGEFRYTGRGTGTVTFNGQTFNDRIQAIRFNADGTFDNSYAQPLRSQLPMNPTFFGRLRFLVMQPNNSLVVVSDSVFRLTSGGSLDGSFQSHNFSKETFWVSQSPVNGNIYVGNLTDNEAPGGIAAFTSTGIPVNGFDTGNWGITTFSGAPGTAFALKDGRVMAGGSFNHFASFNINGSGLISPAGDFISDPNSFYHPNKEVISPLTQVTGWSDGSFVVRESDFGNQFAGGAGANVSTKRYNADGSESPNWNFPDSQPNGSEVLTAVEPGKLLVWTAGSISDSTIVSSGTSSWIRRFNADGTLDPTFNADLTNSLVTITRDGTNSITAVGVGRLLQVRGLLDGSIFLLTLDPSANIRVTHLLANGAVDTNYTSPNLGSGGTTFVTTGATAFDPVKNTTATYALTNVTGAAKVGDFLALPDGSVFVAGSFAVSGQPAGLARILPTGAFDTNFTGTGLAYTGLHPLPAFGNSLGLDDSGRVYLTGRFDSVNGVARAGLARFSSAGVLDTGFNPALEVRNDNLTNPLVLGSAGRLHVFASAAIPGAALPSGYASVPISNGSPVIIGQSGATQTFTTGGTLQLFAGGFGGAGSTAQWFLNGNAITGATSNVLSIPGVTQANAGTYTYTLTNAQSTTVNSSAVTVTISDAPVITAQPQGGVISIGGSITLSVSADGAAPVTFQWQKNTGSGAVDIGGATGSSFTITNAQSGDSAGYTVVVTANGNTGTAVTSNVATVTVNAPPAAPTITLQPVSQSVVSGYTTVLAVAASGTGNSTQWFRDGVLQNSGLGSATVLLADGVTTATASTLTVTNSTITGATQFVANVTGSNGAVVGSNIATLTPFSAYSSATIAGTASPGGADGTGSAARFRFPQGAFVDSTGTVYIADSNNHTIRKITSGGAVTTLAGTANSSGNTDATGSAARFNSPSGVVVDSGGNVYVADTNNNKIRKITSAGVVTTLAGSGSTGAGDGTGAAATFNNPRAIALGSDGNLYVADGNNHKIRKVTTAGVVTTIAGTGVSGFADDSTGTLAQFNTPSGIAADGSGNLFVADTNNHRIRQIVISSGAVTTFAGSGSNGVSTSSTPSSTASFSSPRGITVLSNGTVFVSEQGGQTIRQITGGNVTVLAGTAFNQGAVDGTGTAARFSSPNGIAIDNTGTLLYVTDSNNNAVRKIDISSAAVTTFAGLAPGATDATGTAARFFLPQGIARDSQGNLFVADNNNNVIRKITPAGVVTTFAGTAGSFGSTDGTGSAARFGTPTGIAIDGSDNLYVVDSGTHVVRKVTSGAVVTTLAGTGSTSGSTDGAPGTGKFNSPNGIALDPTSGGTRLYVSDTNNHLIRSVDISTGTIATVAGTISTSGSNNGTGVGNAKFNFPRGIAVDASGNVFVADTSNATIRKIVPSTGVVSTFAGLAANFNTTDGAGTAARFNSPRGLAFESSTGGFVETDSSGAIRRISSLGAVTTIAGSAFSNGASDGAGTSATFNNPTQLTVDSNGVIYIADTNNSVIRRAFSSSAIIINTQPASQNALTGANVSFTVSASGASLNFLWKKNGTAIDTTANPSAATNTLSLTNVQSSDAAGYSVTISNAVTSVTSNTASLTVSNQAANNDFANALNLVGLSVTNTTANLVATSESGEPTNFSGNATNSSLWYKWTPVVSGIATVDTFGSITGTSGTTGQDTAISVYTGTSLSDLAFLASNNDADGTTQSRITGPVTAGTTYFIQVGTNSGSRGNIQLNLSVAVLPAPSADVVIAGQPAQFAVTLDPAQNTFGAQWSRNGVDVGGATSATFNIPSASSGDAGVYLAGITQSVNPADYTFSQPAYLLVAGAGSTTQIDRFDGLAISSNWLPNPLIFLPSTEAGFSVSDQLQFTTASAPFNPIDRALQSATNLPLDRDWSVVTRIGLGTQAQFSGIANSGSTRKAGMSLGVFSPNNSLDALNVGARIVNDGSGTVVRQFFQDFDQGGTGASTVSALGATQTNTLVRLDYSAATGVVTSSVAGATGFTTLSAASVLSSWGLDRSQSLRLVLRGFSTRMAVTPGTVFADDFGLAISPAVITAQPTSRSLSIGGSTTLSVTAPGATAFQWFRNGNALGGEISSTLNLTNVTTGDAGAYTVQVTTANGTVTSAAANVAVNQFEIATQPTHQTVAAGAPATLAVTTSGTGSFTFQWFRNGVAISSVANPSAITDTLNIAAASTTDQGYYTATVSDGTTTLTTRPALLAIADDPNVLRLASAQPTTEFKFANAPSRVYLDGRGGVIVTDFIQFFSANNVGGNRLDAVLRLDAVTGAPDLNFARTPQLAYSAVAAPQPDGTTIVVGSTADDLDLPATRYRLFRYRADGTLDPNYHGAFLSNFVRFITRMPDGRILLAASVATGTTSNEPGAVNISVINRFNSDGTRDTTFTPPTLNTGGFLFAEPKVDSQGRIIIAGSFTSVSGHSTPNVARLLPNGAVDTSFVASGFTPDIAQGIRAAVPVAGDKVLIGGRRLNIGGTRFLVARLNANGSLDSTFTLVQPTNFGFTTSSSNNNTRYIATIPGGRFYTLTENQIIRFFDDGSVDPNFNRVVAPPGAFVGGHVFTQMTTQDDGSFYATYDLPVTQGDTSRTGVIRVTADGTIDPAFNAPEFAHEVFPSIALAKPDGSLIVGGQQFNRVGTSAKGGLVRILANGTVDPNFNVTLPDGMDTFSSGGLTSTGQIYAIASGTTRDSNLDTVVNGALLRYNADGSVDGAFAPSSTIDLNGATLRVQGDIPYLFRNTVADVQAGAPLAVPLNANGSLGTSIAPVGALGAVNTGTSTAALAPFSPIADLTGGGFLMVVGTGSFTSNQTTFDVTLKKLNLNGTFDGTFNGPVIAGVPVTTTGDVSVNFGASVVAYAPFTAATVLSNGNILIAGRAGSYGGVNAPAGVALLNGTTGAVDATFSANLGTGPQLLGTANSFARVDKFVALPNGKILVTGSFDTWAGKPVPGIARINADGTPDLTFFAGVSYYNYLPTTTDMVSAGGNAFWLLGQYRRGVDGWPFAVNRVEFPPAPDIGANPTDQTVVFRGTATFAVSPTGIGPFSFQWFKGTTLLSGQTNSSLVISNAQFTDAGSYSVDISNANGTTRSNSATLTVIDGFAAYRTANFDSTELADPNKSGATAIFGFDGLTNLVKYALGLPAKTEAQSGLPTVTNNGTDWVFTYTRPSTTSDIDYVVEASTDLTNLANWTSSGVTHEFVSVSGGVETWRARVSVSGKPNLFFRLKVTQAIPPPS